MEDFVKKSETPHYFACTRLAHCGGFGNTYMYVYHEYPVRGNLSTLAAGGCQPTHTT